jgi:hypothetical protein
MPIDLHTRLTEAPNDGSYRISITPELTTFSDLVVVSYGMGALQPAEEEAQIELESLWIDMVLQEIQRICARIAKTALDIGLLIRGAVSFGELYHEGSVVLGSALIEVTD